jgi:tetratricopeptide (TPR) repeat protein
MRALIWRIAATWRAVTAALTLVTLAACGAQDRYADHMARGQRYLAAGDLGRASVEFRNALHIKPTDAEALYQLGGVTEQRGSVRDAMRLFQGAIDGAPRDARPRGHLGRILVLGGAPDRALEVIQPGLAAHPDDPDLLAVRAAVRLAQKDLAAARADAARAVQLAPTNEHAVDVLAAVDTQAGDLSAAIAAVNRAVTEAPASIVLHKLLAALYVRAAKPEQAESEMRRIVALEPRLLEPRILLARYLLQSGKPDAAQQVLESAVHDLPDDDQAKLALADFLTAQRAPGEGEKLLRTFIAQYPDSVDLRFGLGTLLQRAGDHEGALGVYQEVVARHRTDPTGLLARDRIAAIAISRGHEGEAKQLIAEVLKEDPRDSTALTLRAQLSLAQGESSNAIADLRAVLQDQPHSVPLQQTLAQAYLANNEPALAEAALRAALQSAPGNLELSLDLARLLVDTQRPGEAVTLLTDTAGRFPRDLRPREVLVSAYLLRGDLDAAAAAAEDLKKLNPEAGQGFYLAALVAERRQRPDEARREFEQALKLAPGSADVLGAYAGFERAQGRAQQARQRVQQAVDADAGNVQALELLGQLELADSEYARAAATFTHAVQLDPHWWVPHRDLALVRLADKDLDGAIDQYQAALAVAPRQPQLLVGLAGVYERGGRINDAIAVYDSLYANHPRLRQLAANNLAMMLVTYKKDAASLERARTLTRGFDTSDDGSLLDTHAWVRFKCGEYQQALIELQHALARDPESRETRFHLGMAELQVGQREQAKAHLESALSGTATFAGSDEARQTLASLEAPSAG